MTQQHTPLPLGFSTQLSVNMQISDTMARDIVRAYENHHALLEALKKTVQYAEDAYISCQAHYLRAAIANEVKKAREAIYNAENAGGV